MPRMSPRQFEKDIRRKVKKAFRKAAAEDIAAAAQFADSLSGVAGVISKAIDVMDSRAPQPVMGLGRGPRGMIDDLSLTFSARDREFRAESSHTHSLGVPSGKRWSTFYTRAQIGPFWHCPYCDADHELTAKLCDCCGARRRREYVN